MFIINYLLPPALKTDNKPEDMALISCQSQVILWLHEMMTLDIPWLHDFLALKVSGNFIFFLGNVLIRHSIDLGPKKKLSGQTL